MHKSGYFAVIGIKHIRYGFYAAPVTADIDKEKCVFLTGELCQKFLSAQYRITHETVALNFLIVVKVTLYLPCRFFTIYGIHQLDDIKKGCPIDNEFFHDFLLTYCLILARRKFETRNFCFEKIIYVV
jgi:hypothetical protein